MDNKQLKDGVGNLFTLRMRDRSATGDGSIEQTMVLASGYPLDYGAGGMFQHCGKSGAMVAGLGANAPIYAFHWPVTLLAVVRRIRISAWSLGTPFSAGLATFELYTARAFTAQYGGGNVANLIGDAAKLRAAMSSSRAEIMYAATVALTPGTRTLDPDPLESRTLAAPATANAPFATAPLTLFDKQQGEHPLLLVSNEGFVIRATVPAAGVWSFAVTTEWDEIELF